MKRSAKPSTTSPTTSGLMTPARHHQTPPCYTRTRSSSSVQPNNHGTNTMSRQQNMHQSTKQLLFPEVQPMTEPYTLATLPSPVAHGQGTTQASAAAASTETNIQQQQQQQQQMNWQQNTSQQTVNVHQDRRKITVNIDSPTYQRYMVLSRHSDLHCQHRDPSEDAHEQRPEHLLLPTTLRGKNKDQCRPPRHWNKTPPPRIQQVSLRQQQATQPMHNWLNHQLNQHQPLRHQPT